MSESIEFENRCSSCKHWKRSVISEFPNEDIEVNVGECSFLCDYDDNDFRYYYGSDIAQEETKSEMISCENLFTHELFGCIHHSKI